MWIIKGKQTYLAGAKEMYDETQIAQVTNWVEDRDKAKAFETKKEAQDFKDEFSITGSIIPA